jgi:hypothetical protein
MKTTNPLDVLNLMQYEAKLKKFNDKQTLTEQAIADTTEILNTADKAESKPNYTNWDYPTWMKNNPNATPEEIKQFFREKKLHDFMIFGR